MPERRRTPLWLWPNLLSLDAPIVALVWLTMFARISRVDFLPWMATASLGLVVWGIYILDRIMDLKLLGESDERLKERHLFHGRHLGLMGAAGLLALLTGAAFALFGMPSTLIGHGYFTQEQDWQVGFLVPGAVMVAGFFVMAISSLQTDEIPHLRNLLAGLAFSYGTAMTAFIYQGNGSVLNLLAWPPMLCFALLCSINISAIHFWEHSRRSPDPGVKAAHELALTLPLAVLAGIAMFLSVVDDVPLLRSFYYAVLMSSALLFILNRNRNRFSLDALRVLADLAMVVPYPFFVAMNHS